MASGGSGPLIDPNASNLIATASAGIARAKASNAVDVVIRGTGTHRLVGAPRLALTYRGAAPTASTHVLAQIVDDATGKVLGNQITPIPLILDGRRRTVSEPLEIIAATAEPGSHFTLQLVAQSTAYNVHPKGGSVTLSQIGIALPAVQWAAHSSSARAARRQQSIRRGPPRRADPRAASRHNRGPSRRPP